VAATRDRAHVLDYGEEYLIELEELIEAKTAHMLQGSCADYADYKAMAASVVALRFAQETFRSLRMKEIEEEVG
jgi:hypothetical protein